jgi:hypothetical protein
MLAAAGLLAPSLTAACAILVFLRTTRADSLGGLLLGWLSAAMLTSHARRCGELTFAGAAYCSVCALGLTLTGFRDASPAHSYAWSAVVVVVASAIPAGLLVVGLIARLAPAHAGSVVGTAALGLMTGMAGWLAVTQTYPAQWSHHEPQRALWCVLLGLVAGSVLSALTAPPDDTGSEPVAWRTSATALLVVSASLPAFQLLAGLGIALLVIGVLAAFLGSRLSRDQDAPGLVLGLGRPAALLAVGLVGVRVATERHSNALKPFELTDHYAVIALLLGVLVPIVLAAWQLSRPGFLRGAVATALAGSWPAVTMAVWGAKSVHGLVLGLGLSGHFLGSREHNGASHGSSLLAMLSLAAAIQFAPIAMAFSDLTRLDRAKLIAYATGVAIAGIVLAEAARRRNPASPR